MCSTDSLVFFSNFFVVEQAIIECKMSNLDTQNAEDCQMQLAFNPIEREQTKKAKKNRKEIMIKNNGTTSDERWLRIVEK